MKVKDFLKLIKDGNYDDYELYIGYFDIELDEYIRNNVQAIDIFDHSQKIIFSNEV